MAVAASLVATLGLDSAQFSKGLIRASRGLKNFQRTANRTAAVVTAGGLGLAAFSKRAITAADDIAKSARNAGLSTTSYQNLAAAFELGGSNAQSLVKASQGLSRQILQLNSDSSTAARALRVLGITQQDLINGSPEDNLVRVITALRGVESASVRSGIAQQLFGRAGKELGTILDSNSESLTETLRDVKALGISIDEDLLGTAEEANDALYLLGLRVRKDVSEAILRFIQESGGLSNVYQRIREVGEAVAGLASAALELSQWVVRNKELVLGFFVAVAAVNVYTGLINIASGIGAITVALRTMSAVLLTHPILALIAGIVAVAGTVITIAVRSQSSAVDDLTAAERTEFDRQIAERVGRTNTRRGQRATIDGEAVTGGQLKNFREQLAQDIIAARDSQPEPTPTAPPAPVVPETPEADLSALNEQTVRSLRRQAEDVNLQSQRLAEDLAGPLTENAERRRELFRQANDLQIEADRIREEAAGKAPEQIEAAEAYARALEGQKGVLENAADAVGSFGERLDRFSDQVSTDLANSLVKADFNNVGDVLVNQIQASLAEAAAEPLKEIIDDFVGGLLDSLKSAFGEGSGGGGFGDIFGSILGFFGFRAEGGPVGAGKSYIVGERGPELFTPHSSGNIVPNDQLGGGGNNVNITYEVRGDNSAEIMRVLRMSGDEIASITQERFRERGLLGA